MTRRQAKAMLAFMRQAHKHICYSCTAELELLLYGKTFTHIGGRCRHHESECRQINRKLYPPDGDTEWWSIYKLPER